MSERDRTTTHQPQSHFAAVAAVAIVTRPPSTHLTPPPNRYRPPPDSEPDGQPIEGGGQKQNHSHDELTSLPSIATSTPLAADEAHTSPAPVALAEAGHGFGATPQRRGRGGISAVERARGRAAAVLEREREKVRAR